MSSGPGSGQIWCRYCKNLGHLIGDCKKLAYNERKKQKNANIVASGQQGSSANIRKCYICDDTTHIAKSCPKKTNF